jgi:hypothetical protein
MSSSYTSTSTYTIVDIRRVMSQVRADVISIAQSSGLWTRDYADRVMDDITVLAESGYLEKILIRAVGADGKNVRVAEYPICEDAQGWNADHSGGNIWKTSAVRLQSTLFYSSKWRDLSAESRARIESGLKVGWTTNTDDLSVAHLLAADQRTYVSNSYGVKKTVYK